MAMAKMDMVGRSAPGDHTPTSQTNAGPLPGRYQFSQIHMGGEVRLTFYDFSDAKAEENARAVFSLFADLEQVMSDYRPSSELMKLCSQAGNGPIPVSSTLYKVIAKSIDISAKTDGAFDITTSHVIRLWREARKTGIMPSVDARKAALQLCGFRKIALNPLHQTVALGTPGMLLDLGGIAKGFANDEGISLFRKCGVSSAMIEAGGDIAVSGAPPETQGWAIKVRESESTIFLKNASISTSGDTEQFVEIDGKRYSHVVDPRTGIGVTNRVQATVTSPLGLTTDPWATSLCVNPNLADICRREGASVTTISI